VSSRNPVQQADARRAMFARPKHSTLFPFQPAWVFYLKKKKKKANKQKKNHLICEISLACLKHQE
jgi:hypothetical protein